MTERPVAFKRGQRVITTKDSGRDDWVRERTNCKWGAEGVVLKHRNSHGWCYLVLHEDGTEEWYDSEEVLLYFQDVNILYRRSD